MELSDPIPLPAVALYAMILTPEEPSETPEDDQYCHSRTVQSTAAWSQTKWPGGQSLAIPSDD